MRLLGNSDMRIGHEDVRPLLPTGHEDVRLLLPIGHEDVMS